MESQKTYLAVNCLPHVPASYLFIIITVYLCFLPIPKIIPLVHGGSLAIILFIFILPFALLYLLRNTQGRWCYLSIILFAIISIAHAKEYDLPLISDICCAIGSMFVIVACVNTRRDIYFTMKIVMLFIIVSALFSALIYFIGEPFVSLRSWLNSDNLMMENETYEDNVFQGGTGLRGSIYMFGYDLAFLGALIIGNTVHTLRKGQLRHILLWCIMIIMIALIISINGQRSSLIIITILSLIVPFMLNVKLRLIIPVAVGICVVICILISNDIINIVSISDRLHTQVIEKTVGIRFYLIESALYALKIQPLAPQQIYEGLVPTVFNEPLPPHVHFLTLLINYGILVLPLILFILWKLGKSMVRGIFYSNDWLMNSFALAMFASLIYGLLHNPGPWLLNPSGVLMLALYGKCLDLKLDSTKDDNI